MKNYIFNLWNLSDCFIHLTHNYYTNFIYFKLRSFIKKKKFIFMKKSSIFLEPNGVFGFLNFLSLFWIYFQD